MKEDKFSGTGEEEEEMDGWMSGGGVEDGRGRMECVVGIGVQTGEPWAA